MINSVFGGQPFSGYGDPSVVRTPEWATTQEWRSAALKVQEQIGRLSDLAARMDAPLRWECYAAEEKAMSLVFSLASRLAAMEARVAELERPSHKRGKR